MNRNCNINLFYKLSAQCHNILYIPDPFPQISFCQRCQLHKSETNFFFLVHAAGSRGMSKYN